MFVVGTLGSYITQGVNTVAGPFYSFGGAVDIIVVQQEDGTFKSSPWYVKFGKFQGNLKREQVVDVKVNDEATDIHMYLDHKGEAFFEKEIQLDDHTILSLPSAPLSGDEMAEFGGTKFLTFAKDSTAKGLEMQEVSNRDSDTNAVRISNECNNPQLGMPDGGSIEHVDTASTACVSDALINEPNNSKVVIAPSQTNSYMVEGQHGTANSNKKMLKKEESRSERLGKRLAKRSESIFGRMFGRKSEQMSPSSSAHGGRQIATKELKSTPSLERAEMVADLLDRKWAVGCKEILLTPTKRWQTTAASTGVGTDSSPLVERGSLMHPSEGSAVVVNDASSGQSGSVKFSRPETVTEGSKQSIMEESKLAETGISMHDFQGPGVVMNEASSGQSGVGEYVRPETLVDILEPPTMENLAIDDSRVNMMRLESFTQSREHAGEKVSEKDRFLNSALEEPTSILGSHERSGDLSSSNDSLYNAIYEGGVQNGRCNRAHTTNEKVAPLGMSDEEVDRSTECVSGTEVVLMSGDGHIITAPVNFEVYQLHSSGSGQHVDSSKEFPLGAFCNRDVQVVGSSSDDSENLESDGRKQPSVVPCNSALGMLEVGVGSGLNQLSGKSEGPVRIEVPAGPLDDEVDAGRASEFPSENVKMSSLKMTPEFVSEAEDSQGTSFQIPQLKSEHSVVTALTAVDRSWEEGDTCVPDDPVVPKFITGQDGMDLQSEPGMNTDHLGTASSCMLDDGIRDCRKFPTSGSMETRTAASSIGDKWAPMHIEADSMTLTDVDLSRPELGSGDLESPGQQGLEHCSSFNGGHRVDLKNEESEADVLKDSLYQEELANLNGAKSAVAFIEVGHKDYGGGDNATAVSEVDDPVFEEWHKGNSLSSSKAVDSDPSKQPFINMDARPGTRSRYRSKPIAVPRCAIKKKVELTSSASVPSRWYEAEREVHVYSRSVGSSPLFNTHQLHLKADATSSFKKDMDESIRQVIEAIIYGSGKDSAVIVNAADDGKSSHIDVDLSVCRHLLSDGMGGEAAARAFASHKVSYEQFQHSGSAIFADDKLVVKIGERYFSWVEAAPYIVDIGASGSEAVYKMEGGIAVETNGFTKAAGSQTVALVPSPTKWKHWPFSVRRSRGERVPRFASTVPTQALLAATNIAMNSPLTQELLHKNGYYERSPKFNVRTFVPTSGQLASLKLKEGSNKVTFMPVLGRTQVDARIYLWKWNTRIVVSDVDGTITKSDVLGQVMPLVGRDWTQSGVTRLFSAIKDNGYEFLFLSARAISQAYLTRQFLLNLKQDGEALPDGPVFISPDGLIPSLYREGDDNLLPFCRG